MRVRVVVPWFCGLSLAAIAFVGPACQSDGAGPGVQVAAERAPTYEGPLDKDRFQRAREAVRPFMSFDDAREVLRGVVGLPGRVRGDRRFWAVLDGERCLELVVENDRGQVGMVGVMAYDPAMKQAFEACTSGLRSDVAQALPARAPDRQETPAAGGSAP